MWNKIHHKFINNLRIYKYDIKTKGLYWSVVHRIYKFPYLRFVLTPLINFFKPDYLMIQGHKLYIDKQDEVVSQELIQSRKWEEYETELFKKNIKKGDTILDIGAHIGYYTLLAARLVGDKGKVYAFEPAPRNFELLKKNIKENGYSNVVLINKAVADMDGESKLFLNNENTGDHRIYNPQDQRKFIKIQTVMLDSFFKNKSTKVDFIKIDVQGSEVRAFKGAVSLIKENRNIKILTEFWPKGLKLSGSSALEYASFLEKNRFQIYDIDEAEKTIKLINIKSLLKPPENEAHDFRNLFCTRN